MWSFKKKQPLPDWYETGKVRWITLKKQGEFEVQKCERECIDMNTGNKIWFDMPRIPGYPEVKTRFFKHGE